MDYFIFILYPLILLKSLTSSSSFFFEDSDEFCARTMMLSANKGSFIFSLHIRMCFTHFSSYRAEAVKLDFSILSVIFGGLFSVFHCEVRCLLWALLRCLLFFFLALVF